MSDTTPVVEPTSCADCGALAHRPHREDCPELLYEPLPDTPGTLGTPPDEVTARWGRLMAPDGEDDDPVPAVYLSASRGQIEFGDMRLNPHVAAQFAERILAAVQYQRTVTR